MGSVRVMEGSRGVREGLGKGWGLGKGLGKGWGSVSGESVGACFVVGGRVRASSEMANVNIMVLCPRMFTIECSIVSITWRTHLSFFN